MSGPRRSSAHREAPGAAVGGAEGTAANGSDPARQRRELRRCAEGVGIDATDLGLVTKEEIATRPCRCRFRALQARRFCLIAGIGASASSVTEIEPGGQISYEDAKADIAKSWRSTLASRVCGCKIRSRNSGPPSSRSRRSPNATSCPRRCNTDRRGRCPLRGPCLSAEDRSELRSDLRRREGKLTADGSLRNNNAYFELGKVEPARDQTFDEVKDALTASDR